MVVYHDHKHIVLGFSIASYLSQVFAARGFLNVAG